MKQQMEGMEKLKEEITKMKIQDKHIDYQDVVEMSKFNFYKEISLKILSEYNDIIK